MLELFLQFVLGKFLFLALHLESGSFPRPLSPKQEQEAFARLAQGDSAARDLIIQHNLRLVVHMAKKYRCDTESLDDLVSIGTIGLIKAVSTFRPERGSRFSTYASRCIENEIKMYFRHSRRGAVTVSLQEPIETGRADSELTVADLLADDFVLTEGLEHREELVLLRQALDRLPSRLKLILTLRYGLDGHKALTQQQTAQRLGISRSYVSRLEKKGLLTLEKALSSTGKNSLQIFRKGIE